MLPITDLKNIPTYGSAEFCVDKLIKYAEEILEVNFNNKFTCKALVKKFIKKCDRYRPAIYQISRNNTYKLNCLTSRIGMLAWDLKRVKSSSPKIKVLLEDMHTLLDKMVKICRVMQTTLIDVPKLNEAIALHALSFKSKDKILNLFAASKKKDLYNGRSSYIANHPALKQLAILEDLDAEQVQYNRVRYLKVLALRVNHFRSFSIIDKELHALMPYLTHFSDGHLGDAREETYKKIHENIPLLRSLEITNGLSVLQNLVHPQRIKALTLTHRCSEKGASALGVCVNLENLRIEAPISALQWIPHPEKLLKLTIGAFQPALKKKFLEKCTSLESFKHIRFSICHAMSELFFIHPERLKSLHVKDYNLQPEVIKLCVNLESLGWLSVYYFDVAAALPHLRKLTALEDIHTILAKQERPVSNVSHLKCSSITLISEKKLEELLSLFPNLKILSEPSYK